MCTNLCVCVCACVQESETERESENVCRYTARYVANRTETRYSANRTETLKIIVHRCESKGRSFSLTCTNSDAPRCFLTHMYQLRRPQMLSHSHVPTPTPTDAFSLTCTNSDAPRCDVVTLLLPQMRQKQWYNLLLLLKCVVWGKSRYTVQICHGGHIFLTDMYFLIDMYTCTFLSL